MQAPIETHQRTLPIGVFDSGMGGLTVLRAMKQRLPEESFIYLGDMARLPYGTKSPAMVREYTVQMAKILIEHHIKALVIACNTATTVALVYLRTLLPDLPILGVVAPGAKAVIAATRNQRIMIFATETTIASLLYQQTILAHLPHADIQTRACSLLVALAEEGMRDNHIARETLRHYLQHFDTQDTLLLGCTHFPVFKPLLQELLPSHVQIVDSATATAEAMEQLLTQLQLHTHRHTQGSMQYFVTDAVERFQTLGPLFLGEPLAARLID